ncbi:MULTISPECIES: GNAT family N-acetyltransferase [unclassified Streptomyces]|uniref:GNAT family N-acetyltransferase n=1 Tax=unclassified Streptomyces TaxID=2593676 RepID=UPI00340A91B2
MTVPALVPIDPHAHTDTLWRLARDRDLAALGRVETARSWIAGRLASPGLDPRRDARLLQGADGEAVGALLLSSSSGVAGWTAELVLGPRGTAADGAELLSFAERRCGEILAERARETGEGGAEAQGQGESEGELSCFVSEEEKAARTALDTCGFGSPHAYYRMAVALDGPLPQAGVRPDAVVRPLRGEGDLRTFHSVKNSAFSAEEAGKREDGFETWLRWWKADPGVDPSQCALLEADGTAVGFANITDRMLDSRNAAYVRQIGVVPQARQRGLGSLLLLSVMHEAQRRGRTAMALTVDTANSPALALYRRLGWRVESRFDDFRRTVAPARAGALPDRG